MTAVHPMWMNYPELHEELKQVKKLMKDSIQIENKTIKDAILSVLDSGGKMVRPAYLILFSMWNDNRNKSSVRRGQETISAKLGNRVAIYAGDYLLTVCYQLLSSYSKDLVNIQIPTRGMMQVIQGELSQMEERYRLDVTVQDYLKRIEGKTAQLFMLSCMMGERFSLLKEEARARQIGHAIGMSFQILDDILDYEIDSHQFGKPVLEDVAQGVYTLPLIIAFPKKEKEFRSLLEKKERISDGERKKVQQLVLKSGGVESAKVLAKKYTDRALQQIERLPEKNVKTMLFDITSRLLQREY